MTNSINIFTEIKGSIAHLWLNRPSVHNAFNRVMIDEFLLAVRSLNDNPAVRIIIIRGKGPSFCAGADLTWMGRAAELSPGENLLECNAMARCFYEVFSSTRITISLIHGSATGGALGLIAASDIAIADCSAVFALSEVRVGLVPATIAPYVIRKTGYAKARELMLTGRKFSAVEAEKIGLINSALPSEELLQHLQLTIDEILCGAPLAQIAVKAYMNAMDAYYINKQLIDKSVRLIAETRIGSEAVEGISAFCEKRKPQWRRE